MKKYLDRSGLLPWLMAMLLTLGLAACGGGKDPILGGNSIANLAPTVTAVAPLPSAFNVSVNVKTITAAFSKAMDPTTLTSASFTLSCPATTPVPGVVSYLASSNLATLTLPAATSLAPNTQCRATVSTAAKDSSGLALANDFVWIFTTGALLDTTAPQVSSTTNANGATGVAINTAVGATFSEAMDPASINATSFTFKQGTVAVAGSTSYAGLNAVFTPAAVLTPNTNYTATITRDAKDLAGNALVSDYVWSWTTAALADSTAPTVTLVNPADAALDIALTSTVNATFSEAMDPLTINTASFTLAGVTGTVGFNTVSRIATFTPAAALANDTSYTATISIASKDLAGNALAVNKVWTFKTVAAAVVPVVPVVPSVNLGSSSTFGTFGGTAGMTNTGTLTIVNGNTGSIATGTSMVTGFHDTMGDIYTETPANIGAVNGIIYTCTSSVTGPTSIGPNAANCALATQARLDAQTAYLALAAMPAGANPGANLAGLTLAPGVYTAPSGSFLIEGGNLTLDAQGNANAVWVFQMATTLTVGGPGAAAPQSIILAGGAQAKNVFWQVGSFATINAAGGGTMVGTILSQAGASFSTAGNVAIVTLQGRALSLGASVTLVDTVINVPAP
jgi:hypothetical protein